jgi:ABC-type multidrug transport system fused ATPase/permease subunit
MPTPAKAPAMPKSVYGYIWRVSGRQQVILCLLTGVVIALSAAPLELQRRITDDAFGAKDIRLLALYCGLYLALILVQGTIKYILNVARGRTVETVSRTLRLQIFDYLTSTAAKGQRGEAALVTRGATVSMISAEAEDLAGFVGDSTSMPLLQGGTAIVIFGYLVWVNPMIAGFAAILYLPQVFIVPRTQHGINRNSVTYAKVLRRVGDIIVALDKASGKDGRSGGHFKRLVNQGFDLRIRIYRMKFLLTALGNFLDALGPLIVFAIGGWLVIHGSIPLSTLVVFISGVQRVSDPWDQLITFYRTASNTQAKYELIRHTLDGDKAAPESTKE